VATRRAPRSTHYKFEELVEGVTFGRARAEGTALSNTGLIDLGGSTLVFDTGLTLRAAADIRSASLALTDRTPSLAANSHWHLDHLLGNQVFAARPIYATKRTIEILLEKRAELESELNRGKIETEIREIEANARAATTEAGRAPYEFVLRINRALLEELIELKLTLPSSGFEGELRLPGDRQARLLTFGSGHTDSDAILFLPESRILFAGDLVVSGNHPNLTSGNPEHWLTVLDKIDELRPEQIATGHGPIGSRETVAEMRDYIETMLDLAQKTGDGPIPARFARWAEPDQFSGNLAYVRGRSTAVGPTTDRTV
jgi:cyclase